MSDNPADVIREVGKQVGDFSECGGWRRRWRGLETMADEGGVFFQWGDWGFSADQIIWEWVGEGGEAKNIGGVWPKQSRRIRVLLQEKRLGGGEPPCPLGALSLCPGSNGLLQHAKGSENGWRRWCRADCQS